MQTLSQLASQLPAFLEGGGYWLLSLIIILEGLPLVGSIFPGHVAIISAGFFAKLGILNIGLILLVAIISAALGDIIGFYLGRRFGYAALQKYGSYFFLKQEHIDKAKKVIDLHIGKTIVLAKFSPLTRSLMPFLVGASGARAKTFWLYNIIGGSLWIVSSVLIGYIFGASYHIIAAYFGKFIFAAIVGTILIIWVYHMVNARFHIFKKYELFILGLNLIALWALLKTIQDGFSTTSFMANFDISVNIFMVEYMTWPILAPAVMVDIFGLVLPLHALGLVIGFIFLMKGKWRRGAIMLLSVTGASVLTSFMSDFFMRERPQNALYLVGEPGFPSAPAALAAAVFIAVMYVSVSHVRSWVRREAFIVLCVALILLVGLMQVVLNLNWASDVIAGWALGVFVASGSVLLVKYAAAGLLRGTK